MPTVNNHNRKSPVKQQQQRIKHSHSIPVAPSNNGRMRSTSSMAGSYPRMFSHYHYQYSTTTSPTAMSASSLPAVPLFYSDTYADPPECSSLPKPPESWYLPVTESASTSSSPVKSTTGSEEEDEEQKPVNKRTTKPTSAHHQSQRNYRQTSSRACYYTSNNQGFYSPFYASPSSQAKLTPYVSVKA